MSIFAVVGTGIYYFLTAIEYILLFRAVLSWFMDQNSTLMHLLINFTEPFVAPVRALIMRIFGRMQMVDFSILITMVLINVLKNVFITMLL